MSTVYKKIRETQMAAHEGKRKSWFIQIKEYYAVLAGSLVCNLR